ncbi:DUF3168 domain-containing protein [Qipengyuania sp. DSG2-2]|uniref:DUF3168 domain-containing protein n=1 Tax=Qipengyuania sp. DGS2-2 TaxID=3349631 RepID=UPI0036D3FFD7
METQLRTDLLGWLRGEPTITAAVNLVDEAETSRAMMPWLALVASASVDWSSKTHTGREIRIALELRHRGDVPGDAAELLRAIEARVETLPTQQNGYEIAGIQFLRARTERRAKNERASLVEYRFRVVLT